MLLVANKTRQKLPSIAWSQIAAKILGSNYELSLVLIGDKRSRALNKKYRAKDKPTNVLSFPLTVTSGELFLNLLQVKRECKKYHRSYSEHTLALFIHGLLHLAGLDHGSTMEAKERKFLKLFGNGYQSRHRS